jgi:hypothetical protein
VIERIYRNDFPNGIERILKSKKSKSFFLKIVLKIGSLKYAINNVAAALIPPVSEKKSMQSPNRKLRNMKIPFSFLSG